jgi:hypothetical protein
VFFLISTHSTATPGIPLSSPILKQGSFNRELWVEPRDFTVDLPSRLRALYAQSIRTTLATSVLPRLLAQSWPWLPSAVPSIPKIIYLRKIRSARQEFTIRRPSSSTRRRFVRLAPIAKYSPLLPPVGVWTVSQFQCGWSSSQTSYPS